MKTFVYLSLLLFSMNTFAQKAKLIDRELFFGNPEISGAQISPDGQYITFLKEYEGIMNLWIKKNDEPFDKAIPLTNQKRPMYGYFWTIDSKYILFVKDKDGDENMNIYALNPKSGKLPEARNLTPMKEITAQIIMASRKDPNKLVVGINDRDKAWHDLYELNISNGNLKMLYENKDRITDYNFDWDENLRLLSKTDEKGNTFTYRINNDKSLEEIYSVNVNEGASFLNWNKDNSEVYLETNKGALDLSSLFLMNPNTKKLTLVEKDPKNQVDFGSLFIDENTREIISTSYFYDKRERHWKNKKWEQMFQFLTSKFPNQEIGISSFTKDYKKMLINISGDRFITEVYYFDTETQKLTFQYCPKPKLKAFESELVSMTPIRYKSSDGLEIPGYLSIPKGMEGQKMPLIALVHGGPKGPRDYWGYSPEVQFLCNRGYAVFQPNFRASGGYGKAFLNAGDKQWGKLMQDDITFGVKHLIEKGIADPSKLVIMGGSYGGYATLAGLAFTPDLYACGVDIVGPSNIFTLLESIPPYWEAGKAMLYGMVGDPNTEEGKKLLQEASPLFHVNKINKPLLVIQGANDPRVKQAEADQIVVALRDKGKKVGYILAPDEGHGFYKPVNNMAMYAAIEKFLSEVIGGTYQKDMKPEVEKRLKEITVDINKVVLKNTKAVETASTLPKINAQLKEGSFTYNAKIEVQGQVIPIEMTRTVSIKNNQYIIKDVSKAMMGSSEDEVTLDMNLTPIQRKMNQGGMNIESNYSKEKCQVNAMGKNMEIAFDKAFLIDGPSMDVTLAHFPLKDGFTLNCLMPDMMTMKNKTISIKYIGLENNLHKVEAVSQENENDKTTFWIDTTLKMARKMEVIMPAMGNAILTMELK